MIGSQSLQAGLDRCHDVAARCANKPACLVHRHSEFGGEDQVIAPMTHYLTEKGFRTALAVDVGRIDHRDAEVENFMQDLARSLKIHADAEIVATEPNQRHAQARCPELSILHGQTCRSYA